MDNCCKIKIILFIKRRTLGITNINFSKEFFQFPFMHLIFSLKITKDEK